MDLILLDVPCSGLGTLSSNPEIRWLVKEEMLAGYQRRQLNILNNGFKSLRPGGKLLYSTCSTEPEENEEVIDQFLAREKSARLDEVFLKPRPGKGFFGACLLKSPS
jgi:16S rRNA (cytosine967-C5)-methyltransferase